MSVLEVDRLFKEFPIRSGLLQRETSRVRAVQDVSFTIGRGETLALVGESCRRPRARFAFRPTRARASTWPICRGAHCGHCGVTSR